MILILSAYVNTLNVHGIHLGHVVACGPSFPDQGSNPRHHQWKQSPDHWTTEGLPGRMFLRKFY